MLLLFRDYIINRCMSEIKISVIVPVYNVEQYIEKCVRSLMEQTMKDGIEFIFINDCTPDDSMQILERVVGEYPERNGQVVIGNNSSNVGVSESRRKGIELAKGEYIGWCDSDDWCEKAMFEEMCKVAYIDSSDIVVCNYWDVIGDEITGKKINHSANPHEAVVNSNGVRTLSGFLWNQIIKKKYYEKCWNAIVPTSYGEDTFVLFHIYYYAKTIRYVEEFLYDYRKDNSQSLTHFRDNSRQAWLIQKENMERVERLYYHEGGWKKFHVALNFFIFERKCLYKETFESKKEFFDTFRRASRDILHFYDWRKLATWKMYLAHNIYFFFKHSSAF